MPASRNRARLIEPAILVLIGLACTAGPDFGIEFAPSARSPSPAFVVSGGHSAQFIVIERDTSESEGVPDATIWHLMRMRESAVKPPISVEYGTVPSGYREMRPAIVLVPGQYRVRVRSIELQGVREFRVEPDGRIVPGRAWRFLR